MPGKFRRRIARLAAEQDLTEVARIAGRRGERAWIVGGALRDLALSRRVPEVDVAVEGDAGAIAREMESSGRGRAVLLSGDRKPRVFRVAGRVRILDLAEIEETIEADLARRDFTVNAMAVELPTGKVLDPQEGLTDLSRRRLRMVSEENLADDPLRALRAARLFASHGLGPDRATSQAVRRVAGRLERVARERVQAELAKILEAPRAAPALDWAATNGLLSPALQIRLAQSRWRRIARAASALDSPSARKLPRDRLRRLRLAFFAGKAGLTGERAASWLRSGRWGTVEAGEVARLLDLSSAAATGRGGEDDWRWILAAGNRAPDALRLLELLEPRSRLAVRRLRARLARLRPIPAVRGADVLEWARIQPGPEVGRLLDAVRIEALAGRIRSRADARRWLKGRGERR